MPEPAHTPEAGAAAPEAPATAGAESGRRALITATGPEWAWKKIKGITKWTSKWIWDIMRGTTVGAWKMTGGAVVGGVVGAAQRIDKGYKSLKEIGSQIAERAKAEHNIGTVGPIIGGILKGTALAIGTVLMMPVDAIGGAVESVATGGSRVVSGVLKRYDQHSGGGAPSAPASAPTGHGEGGHGHA